MDQPCDLILENALLVDGTGAKPRKADVALRGDRIAEVSSGAALPEPVKAQAKARVNLQGRVLCPGFVDVHAHGELEPFADPSAAGKVLSGVTTEISGNCGLSPFPLYGELRTRYEREARDEYQWGPEKLNWTSTAEYFTRLEEVGCSINRGFLLGHGCVRAAVRGYSDAPVAPSHKKQMLDEVEKALDAGCFGLSTGLVYPPGCFADADEIIDLAKVCARKGALYTSHMRSESDELEKAIDETLDVCRKSGARTQISHLKTAHARNWHKIKFLEERLWAEKRAGLDFHADRYPYVASGTGLDAVLPRWAYAGGVAEELKRLRDPETNAKLKHEVLTLNNAPDYWSRVVVGGVVDDALRGEIAGKSIAEIAGAWKCEPWDAFVRITLEDKARTSAIFFSMSEGNLEKILSWDFVMIGSDATARNVTGPTKVAHPHPRTFGTYPRMFARYVREKKLFPLEEAVRRMTSLCADTFHIEKRGRVAAGCFADLVVFDYDKIEDRASFTDPNQFPVGIERVYVNGRLAALNGAVKDSRAGLVLRHGQKVN